MTSTSFRRSLLPLALVALAAPAMAQFGGGGAQPEHQHQEKEAAQQPPQIPTRQQVRRQAPPLTPDMTTNNLGFVKPEDKVAGEFKLKNTGDEKLTISRTTSSCSCTIAELDKKELEPGESVTLTATLEAGKFPGATQKSVRVFVEGYAIPLQLWISAEVSYGVRATPVFVDAFQTRKGTINLESVDKKPFSVVTVNGEAPTFSGFNPETDEPRSVYTLAYDFEGIEGKTIPMWWVVETTHPEAPVVDMRIINPENIPMQDPGKSWSLEQDRVILGQVEQGKMHEFSLAIRGRGSVDSEPTLVGLEKGEGTLELLEVVPGGSGVEMHFRYHAPTDSSGVVIDKAILKWGDHEDQFFVFGRVGAPAS